MYYMCHIFKLIWCAALVYLQSASTSTVIGLNANALITVKQDMKSSMT